MTTKERRTRQAARPSGVFHHADVRGTAPTVTGPHCEGWPSPRHRRAGPPGFTLILTLGFLAVLAIAMLSLALTARTERRAAAVASQSLKARLFAASGVERAMAVLENNFAHELYPGSTFFRPPAGHPWHGRGYLPSINGADTLGITQALASRVGSAAFTPEAELHPNAGWIPVRSSRNIGGENHDVLIGRYTYLVIDESGKIDPGAAVSPVADEDPDTRLRTGESPTDLCLADADLPRPDIFRPDQVETGAPGRMPPDARWFSVTHIARALRPDPAEMSGIVRTLHPYSHDTELFWRDRNGDGRWAAGEDEERTDLAGSLTAGDLYSLFLGPDVTQPEDDCAWLKELDSNPWVQAWRDSAGATQTGIRQRIAAQIAANIVDYADADSIPTPVHITTGGQLEQGTCDEEGTFSLYGVEKAWGISELAMRVQATVVVTTPEPGTCSIAGDLNVNPGNSSSHYFTLACPGGNIDRATLMDRGAGFSYNGPAGSVTVRPKAQGRTLVINGQSVVLANQTYTITSTSMTVHLRNLNPGARNWAQCMGHWWLQIDADNATITPDPGIPPPVPVPTALRITPGFRGEVFFPYETGANVADPPGALSVAYSVIVNTATGETGVAQGTMNVPLAGVADVDGGTLMYSADYTDAETEVIVDAFDLDATPPANWFSVGDARITAAVLAGDETGSSDCVPVGAGGDAGVYLCNWAQSGSSTASTTLYASLRASDPMANDRGERDHDFLEYWTPYPDALHLAADDRSDIGGLDDDRGYDSASYCDVAVANAPFSRLGELGRVHSYQPLRSLRLWAAQDADEAGNDGEILDLFRIGPAAVKRGRINVNSLESPVLETLFAGATTASAEAAAAAVLSKRAAGGTFANIGQLFGGIAGMSGSNPSRDAEEEQAVTRLAELVTVRQNYFSVLVCAQSLHDVGGTPYDADGDGTTESAARYGTLDLRRNTQGEVIGMVDRVLAEQKVLAVLRRDAYSGKTHIERYELLPE